MRNTAARIAIEQDCEYLFFYDDDVIIPHDCIQSLLACEADVAAGLTYIRGYPFKPMAFRFKDKYRKELSNDIDVKKDRDSLTGFLPCDAVGFSCVLIRVELLRKLDPPYFVTGTHNTEDIYFCLKATAHYPNTSIVVNTNVKCGHLLDKYPIDTDNFQLFKELEEELYGVSETKDEESHKRCDMPLEVIEEWIPKRVFA